ncbi:methyltransferase domain-containing protein [Altererythrobacter lutimaris]|uniref:Methyltransferase domain-containing protein n=1 Tax=Altererythrobacter lutimaris TaxID=2743979 RepID=A0A850H956_9SPHN|nr:methyltransferase domain-containing protein [Altererythrobacter lutimaris]NVE93765.1 methyltransferase domain-containing protein [Altererythrobacter lutimaris]
MNSLKSSKSVPTIFSRLRRDLAIERAEKLASNPDAATWLAEDFADEIGERLDFMQLSPPRALVCGPNGAVVAKQLVQREIEVTFNSLVDHESPISAAQFDLILACGSLETVNDLPGALIHLRNALSEDGLFIGQMLGAGSVPALRQIMLAADGDRPAARIHPQVDNRAATALLERAGFKRQVVDSRTLQVRFSSLDRLVSDSREQALTSVLLSPAPYVGKSGLERAQDAFASLSEEDGKVTETFEILTLTGWR